MLESKRTVRTLSQQEKTQGFSFPSLYDSGKTVNFGSESNANFVDVISIGPITSIDDILINDTQINTEEFPLSQFYLHRGDSQATPFDGDFPYAERTYSLNKQAEIIEGDNLNIHKTTFKRSVSSLGVVGIRVNFNTAQFIHRDKENRRKAAFANFALHLLDESGSRIKSTKLSSPSHYYASNPTSVNVTLMVDQSEIDRVWDYEVEMNILTNRYGTIVSGTWTASTVTELYKDTQTYKDIAMVSGKVVATDAGGSVPKRQYLVKGYQVDVPKYNTIGNEEYFLGEFEKATSDSHAWNAMAVLVDDKWGAGLPLDKINIASFIEFDNYLKEVLPDGSKRFSHSQALVKADNFFRIASQIVGAAEGKLFEDTSGRIGVIVDKQTDARRVITSYDLLDEKVKRTTVPEKKKTNHVQAEYDDKDNNYLTTIISTQDDLAIVKNGLISQKLKLDTCTDSREAKRVINKILVTSQVTTDSYVFTVGHTHEDIQIGEVVALFDRNYSRVNYCGKTAEGSTTTRILVDPRTSIDLDGISNPQVVLDNGRGVPVTAVISSWTDSVIELSTPLQIAPDSFTSFGVESSDSSGLKPTLVKVLGVTDNNGKIQVEGIDYNDSLYNHVENDAPLIIPITKVLPTPFEDLTGLSVIADASGLTASWDVAQTQNYVYYWKKYVNDPERNPAGNGVIEESGATVFNTISLDFPLEPAKYTLFVYILDPTTGESSSVKSVDYNLGISEDSQATITPPSELGVINPQTQITSTAYTGNSFTIGWTQEDITGLPSGYLLRVTQGGLSIEYNLLSTDRSQEVTTTDLVEKFGEDYDRSFIISLIAYDGELSTTSPVVANIDNTAPFAPVINVQVTGDVKFETQLGQPVPEDVIESLLYVWESENPNDVRPADAIVLRTNQLVEISIPDDFIVYDGRSYNFEGTWVDSFGDVGSNFSKVSYTFDPDLLVPVPANLERAIPINSTTVQLEFTHDGTWLKKVKAFYRKYGSDNEWTQVSNIYTLPAPVGETDRDFDPITGIGYVQISGLAFNTEYEYYAQVANENSVYSLDSNIINGAPATFIDTEDLESFLGSLDPRALIVEGTTDVFEDDVLNRSIVKETVQRRDDTSNLVADLSRIRSDFNTSASQATAAITDLSTVFTSSSQAIAKQVGLLEVGFNDNTAAISSISQALVDETQARVVSIQDLTAKLITETNIRVAQITQVSQAIANEETIRAQQFTQLTAVDEANADEIATVAENAIAAIGYCTIGGGPASQGDKSSCEAAGGIWTEAPLAEAVRQTQVTSGGDTATVGSHYQSFVGLNNELVGKATIGVDTGGVFTGLSIVGGDNLSSITFQGDTFKVKDTSGADALYWSAADGEWKFSGGGTFTGTLAAPIINSGTFNGGTFNGGNFIGNNFTGGQFVTASGTASRIDIEDDGTYLIWAGSGAKTDINGTFWIKSNGTGFIKGEFFQGEIIESKAATGSFSDGGPWVTTANNHNSAGKPVRLEAGVGLEIDIDGDKTASVFWLDCIFKRGGTTIHTSKIYSSPLFYDSLNQKTKLNINGTALTIDTDTTEGLRDYSVTLVLNSNNSFGFQSSDVVSSIYTTENKLS